MSKIIRKNNNPFIEINGELIAPAAFRSFRPTPSTVSLFSRCGVKLYQVLVSDIVNALHIKYSLYGEVWSGVGEYNFDNFDKQMAMFMKFAPDGYFCVFIDIDMPDWWLEQHPDTPSSYRHLGQTAFCEAWRRAAADYLKALITYAEEKYGDRIYAYGFAGGLANEWFAADLGAGTPEKERLYREYVGDPDAVIPQEEDYTKGSGSYRSPQSNEYRYLVFASSFTPDLICYFAAEAQSVLCHRKLIGLFFGYMDMEPINQNRWLTNGYEKVWNSPDIDMLFSPAAYGPNRKLDGVSSYQVCVDSIKLNGKTYLHEIDHRTELAYFPTEDGGLFPDCYETHGEAVEVLRRELCSALSHQSAYWWFDFTGGYYSSPDYEKEITRQLEIYNTLSERRNDSVAEIAVFVDPMSFLYFKENVNLHQDCVRHNVDALLRCGAPFELYNLADLEKLDTQRYKLFVFLNAVEIKNRAYIGEKLKDKYTFFVGAANYSDGTTLDVGGISAVTGMTVREFETDKPLTASYNGISFGYGDVITPLFEVSDREAEVLCRYEDGGVAAAKKGKTFYCAVGNIPYSLFTEAAECAGVHIYNRSGNGLAVTTGFVSMYSMDTDCTITMPYDCTLTDLFDGDVRHTENGKISYKASPGQTKLFRID